MPEWAIAAGAEDVGAVGELDCARGVLLDEQDRHALLAQLLERVEDDVDHDRREPERRLVEEQQPRRESSARAIASCCCSPPESVARGPVVVRFERRKAFEDVARGRRPRRRDP